MKEYKHPLNWKPAPFTIFKNKDLQNNIEENGYAVVDFIAPEELSALLGVYNSEHQIESTKGGMFYSVYSKDTAYRKRIHEKIDTILSPHLSKYFKDYKNSLNFFINKLSGDNSAFSIHQDSSAIDEFKYSALSVWMPLQDVDETNGALWLVEKTHLMFSPFRSVSFSPPFSNIRETVKNYLKPIRLKAGQALIFDARVIHTSGKNTSGKDRLAVVSGILPKAASFQLSYQDKSDDP
ncbi:MAG: phytanoyl-CoA dioxygenase family protein, partial [Flavobacteriales bacterium]|nr:phytanoyl-CoA dioxygenase family protein [Flavobacteriales bacterium]